MASERLTDEDIAWVEESWATPDVDGVNEVCRLAGRMAVELQERRAADPVARIAANNEHTCFLTGKEMEALRELRRAVGGSMAASDYRDALAVLDKILGGDRG